MTTLKKEQEQNQMSKRDYEMLAKAIREWTPNRHEIAEAELRASIARAIGAELLNTNPRFQLTRFIAACVKETVA
jgi:hypothetical protein